jgi:hypothetical protein
MNEEEKKELEKWKHYWNQEAKKIEKALGFIDEIQAGWELAMEFERSSDMRKIQLSAIRDCKRLRSALNSGKEMEK